MKIIFEDDDILVCLKPQGVLSQSDKNGKENAVSMLEEQCNCEIFPVHRLDSTTIGLMVFAKHKTAAAELSRQIQNKEFEKTYIAFVHGEFSDNSGEMQDLLFFDRNKNKSFVVDKKRAGVKEARLQYKVLGTFNGGISELEIELETGRTHQIRVQCAARGHSLLGDSRYGARDQYKNIALCAARLSFAHPTGKTRLNFDIKLCEEYALWREYFACN